MTPDKNLRQLVRAIRKANATQSEADARRAELLTRAYSPSLEPLDVDAAIRELEAWGTTDRPIEVSPELRCALILFLKRRITQKRGTKTAPRIEHQILAFNAARRARELGTPLKHEIRKQVARHNERHTGAPITYAAVEALIYPRDRKRKT